MVDGCSEVPGDWSIGHCNILGLPSCTCCHHTRMVGTGSSGARPVLGRLCTSAAWVFLRNNVQQGAFLMQSMPSVAVRFKEQSSVMTRNLP